MTDCKTGTRARPSIFWREGMKGLRRSGFGLATFRRPCAVVVLLTSVIFLFCSIVLDDDDGDGRGRRADGAAGKMMIIMLRESSRENRSVSTHNE